MHTVNKSQRDEAEKLVFEIISYIFSDENRLGAFLGTTGMDVEDLKTDLMNSEVQTGILEYLLGREDLLMNFCDTYSVDPGYPKKAASILSGVTPDW